MQLNKVLDELAKKHGNVVCVRVEAEQQAQLSERSGVTVVPSFLFWSKGKEVLRVEGAKTAEVVQAVEKLCAATPAPAAAAAPPAVAAQDLSARLVKLVNYDLIMLFMKGTPAAPQCGFSRQAVELLNKTGSSCCLLCCVCC